MVIPVDITKVHTLQYLLNSQHITRDTTLIIVKDVGLYILLASKVPTTDPHSYPGHNLKL